MQNYRLSPTKSLSVSIADTLGTAGPDFTPYLISADGGYSAFSEGGLIARTGEIRLSKRVPGLPLLREWDFIPGCRVSITYVNDALTRKTAGLTQFNPTLTVPVIGGWMFIEKVTTSEDDAEIIIGISDGITLCSGATPSNIEICEKDPIKEVTIPLLFTTIINRVGLDKLIAGIDSSIFVLPLPKTIGPVLSEVAASSLTVLGQLMFMAGYNLYIDTTGLLTYTRKLTPDITTPSSLELDLSSNKLLKFFRTGDGALLPTDYKIETYDCENVKTPLTDQKTSKDGDLFTSYQITYNPVDRTITRDEVVRDRTTPYIFIKETKVVETYETTSGVDAPIGGTRECNLYDPGRILSRVTTVREPVGIARAGFIAARKKAEADDPGLGTTVFPVLSNITSSITEEVWTYQYKDTLDVTCEDLGLASAPPQLIPTSGGQSTQTFKYVKTVTVDNANLWPAAGDPRLGRGSGPTFVFDDGLSVSEVTTLLYRKNERAKDNTWDLSTTVIKSRLLADPDEVELQVTDTTIPLSTVVANAYQLVGDRASTEPNTSPDEPVRFPQLRSRKCKPKCYTLKSRATRVRGTTPKSTKSISFPDHFEWENKQKILTFVNEIQFLDVGRNSSYSMVGSFDQTSDITDEPSYTPPSAPDEINQTFAIPTDPLQTLRVKKDYQWYFMFVDSIRVAISATEMYWSCLGLLSEIKPDPDAPVNPGSGGGTLEPPSLFKVDDITILDPREDVVIKGILNTLTEVYYLPE